MRVAHHSTTQPRNHALAVPANHPDAKATDQSARDGLCRRLVLLSTLADASHGTERVVLEARVHLVFRTIARLDSPVGLLPLEPATQARSQQAIADAVAAWLRY